MIQFCSWLQLVTGLDFDHPHVPVAQIHGITAISTPSGTVWSGWDDFCNVTITVMYGYSRVILFSEAI